MPPTASTKPSAPTSSTNSLPVRPPNASATPPRVSASWSHRFRQQPERSFFLAPSRGPQAAPKKDQARDLIIRLRKQNLSIYDISRVLERNGYQSAKSRHLFADFVDASAQIHIGASDIVVRFQKRAHNPYLLAAGFDKTDQAVPWLGRKRLRLVFG